MQGEQARADRRLARLLDMNICYEHQPRMDKEPRSELAVRPHLLPSCPALTRGTFGRSYFPRFRTIKCLWESALVSNSVGRVLPRLTQILSVSPFNS